MSLLLNFISMLNQSYSQHCVGTFSVKDPPAPMLMLWSPFSFSSKAATITWAQILPSMFPSVPWFAVHIIGGLGGRFVPGNIIVR